MLILQYQKLLIEKNSLSKELELSTRYERSSEIATSKDLLNKLNESLNLNKQKLKFFEEDFIQHKNQINQIKKKLDEYNSIIKKLTDQKKKCFSQINRITRKMSGNKQESKNNIQINIIDSTSNLSNAEKIQAIQKKAKEIQSEIKNIESKKSQTYKKLEKFTPRFNILEKDHQSLLDIINTDKKRIQDLESEIKNRFKEGKSLGFQDFDSIDLKSLRSSKAIKNDIEKIEKEINTIKLPEESFNPQNPNNLSLIISKFSTLYEKIGNKDTEIVIKVNENEISKCFKQFAELENSISNIESLINLFLLQINLKSQLKIQLSADDKSFLISLIFIRKDKEHIKFEELTTPEKIFFIIVFYISIKLHINKPNIIFSNISILTQYNKAGSIYRTIRKILPIFEAEDRLSKFNLVFIISNLELKKTIKNLNIITINES